jgi:catechol 2,3-dioxygenase-like lactoylglutathione lyase family enzyme
MLKNFDHPSIVVRDIDRAKAFFRALGFEEASAFSTLAIAALMVRSARRARLEPEGGCLG